MNDLKRVQKVSNWKKVKSSLHDTMRLVCIAPKRARKRPPSAALPTSLTAPNRSPSPPRRLFRWLCSSNLLYFRTLPCALPFPPRCRYLSSRSNHKRVIVLLNTRRTTKCAKIRFSTAETNSLQCCCWPEASSTAPSPSPESSLDDSARIECWLAFGRGGGSSGAPLCLLFCAGSPLGFAIAVTHTTHTVLCQGPCACRFSLPAFIAARALRPART